MEIALEPYYQDKYVTLYHGDCRSVVSQLEEKATSVVTDPPYELSFMGRDWDSRGVSFSPATWSIIRGACKPGAMMLSFGGTRTAHRIAVAIEDGGWEVRDNLMWVYGTGMSKGVNISKAIDKMQGAERVVVGRKSPNVISAEWRNREGRVDKLGDGFLNITVPATEEAQLWDGWHSALKPAYEPILLSMNPLDGTFANNALQHNVAGINVDGCRVEFTDDKDKAQAVVPNPVFNSPTGSIYNFKTGEGCNGDMYDPSKGRFPSSLIHDGSEEVLALFPQSSARFFYCAKASRSERGDGNTHTTVKPLSLMEYLCKLVSYPVNTLILDPFCGSGTTLVACTRLGLRSIGIDSDEESCKIAAKRCTLAAVERIKRGEY